MKQLDESQINLSERLRVSQLDWRQPSDSREVPIESPSQVDSYLEWYFVHRERLNGLQLVQFVCTPTPIEPRISNFLTSPSQLVYLFKS